MNDIIDARCGWAGSDELYIKYHDEEWGRPVTDDRTLFEFLVLESAQAGLSWITILRKREGYRTAFHHFDIQRVARMTSEDIDRLMQFGGIVRNRLKIAAAIANARLFIAIQQEFGSFYDYVLSFFPDRQPVVHHFRRLEQVPATSAEADALSGDMKKRGFKFFGPTICYAFLQATGFVNDHLEGCRCKVPDRPLPDRRAEADSRRTSETAPTTADEQALHETAGNLQSYSGDMLTIEEILTIDSGEAFERTALELFAFQAERCAPYRDYLDAIGIAPGEVTCSADIPHMPIELFKSRKVYCGTKEPELVFTSSTTGGDTPARHYVENTENYRQTLRKAFSLFYGRPENWSFYALLPCYLEREGSSLVWMADDLIRSGGGGFFLDEYEQLLECMAADSRPKILLGVSYALLDLAEQYAPRLRDTVVMETGGMKGRRTELPKEEFHRILCDAFGTDVIHSEYGMAELTSQAYSSGNGIFRTPPWMRVMIRDFNDPFETLPAADAAASTSPTWPTSTPAHSSRHRMRESPIQTVRSPYSAAWTGHRRADATCWSIRRQGKAAGRFRSDATRS